MDAEGKEEPAYQELVPETGAGRHQQLAVDDFVTIAVVGELADHLSGPVDRRGHAHSICSSACGEQGCGMAEQDARRSRSRHRSHADGNGKT